MGSACPAFSQVLWLPALPLLFVEQRVSSLITGTLEVQPPLDYLFIRLVALPCIPGFNSAS